MRGKLSEYLKHDHLLQNSSLTSHKCRANDKVLSMFIFCWSGLLPARCKEEKPSNFEYWSKE